LAVRAWQRLGRRNPILLKDCLSLRPRRSEPEDRPAARRGRSRAPAGRRHRRCDPGARRIRRRHNRCGSAFNILQAAGCRSFKTDYVACPSCGRTLFNLQTVTARIKARTDHLKGVKIAIMGCIVNGPGEMADADFGYVGGAPNKINLYVGKKPVKFDVPTTRPSIGWWI
jgi:(E)-4-hydroxy-3-methylbut-2-enyl-diphosphate synthase